MEALVLATTTDDSTLLTFQERIAHGARVIELGAGVGLLGTTLAWAGAQVLLTDLPTLTESAIQPNLIRNSSSKETTTAAQVVVPPPPSWLANLLDQHGEPTVRRVGNGWAASTSIDWTIPLESQIPLEQRQAVDIIVASDCIWLASLLDSLLDTAQSLFDHGASTLLMAFQKREMNIGSATFTTIQHLLDALKNRGWSIQSRAWRPVTLLDGTETEAYLLEIQPCKKQTL